ncbi:hypothetical protein ACOJTA_10685 [Malaciobacter sp. WC5094]
MINMKSLHHHPYYIVTLNEFQSLISSNSCNYRNWGLFSPVHLTISKDKCPICECSLDGSLSRNSNNGQTVICPTIDHYRPKDSNLYPLLKCDHKNYLLMCTDCNNAYKGNQFPLHISGNIRDIISASTDLITTEKPLIVNPIYDDLLELFILVFRLSPSGKKVLELKPKESSGYLYEKAKETIRLFSLGNCEVDVHPNLNVQNCRIDLLHSHFNKFYEFIDALKQKNNKKALHELKTKKLDQYGFYDFIMKQQFEILIP